MKSPSIWIGLLESLLSSKEKITVSVSSVTLSLCHMYACMCMFTQLVRLGRKYFAPGDDSGWYLPVVWIILEPIQVYADDKYPALMIDKANIPLSACDKKLEK